MKTYTKFILCAIVVLAFFLRFYKLGSIPPSISWDEASAGYNGWTIANYGRDEWGNLFPVVFKSFNVDMNPVWIYAISLSTKFLGLSEVSTRLPSALFGVVNVILLFYLARLLFKNDLFGLIAALSLAVSPFNLQFSRGAWEANSALLFFLLGIFLFFYSLKEKKLTKSARSMYQILAFASFGIDLFTYESSKIITPLIVGLLVLLYAKELLKDKKTLLISLIVFIFFTGVILANPALSGRARAAQSKLSDDIVHSTQWYKNTHNYVLGYAQAALAQYPPHFEPKFLFISGDANPKLSVQKVGEFYWVDLPFLLLGLIFLLYKRSRITIILLAWLLLAPIPSSLVAESPHAHRSLFLMGSMNLLIALGAVTVLLKIKNKMLYLGGIALYVVVLAIPFYSYFNYYFTSYSKDRAIDWQYGMKQVVEYVKDHPEYTKVYMTSVRAQPYIFFLYYLRVPLYDFRDTVVYNTRGSEGQSLVDSFDKFHFNDWNSLNCPQQAGVLCIVSNNEYGGLVSQRSFRVNKLVKYPNGDPAFYIVSIN